MQVGHAHTVNFHLVAPHFVPLAATRAFIRITEPSAGAPLPPRCSAAQRWHTAWGHAGSSVRCEAALVLAVQCEWPLTADHPRSADQQHWMLSLCDRRFHWL